MTAPELLASGLPLSAAGLDEPAVPVEVPVGPADAVAVSGELREADAVAVLGELREAVAVAVDPVLVKLATPAGTNVLVDPVPIVVISDGRLKLVHCCLTSIM